MKCGGKRPGAGRPLGAKSKVTLHRQEHTMAELAKGKSPLAFMLAIMRNVKHDVDTRLEAAKNAAPYCHPRLASIEHSGKNGGPITVEISGVDSGLL